MDALRAIRTVLIRPTHPGNIGGVARALKNMGLEQLYLVGPSHYPSAEATARAAGAEDVLARAMVCDDLEQAIGDCHFVVGTTVRVRHVEWPALDPPGCAQRLLAEARRGPVALLFGPERAGLTNAELDRCHALGYIPSNPAYPSLNLACAVQVVVYEIYRAASAAISAVPPPSEPPATDEEMQHFHRQLEQVLVEIGFLDPANPRLLLRRVRRLFNRAELDKNEVGILRGILTAVQNFRRKLDKNGRE